MFQVTVYRSRIVVADNNTKAKPREFLLHRSNRLPLLLAVLATEQNHSPQGVSDRVIWRSKLFSHLKSVETVRKTVQREIAKLEELRVGGGQGLLRIEHGAGMSAGTYRLVSASNTTVRLDDDLKSLLAENAPAARAPWQLLPDHDRNQLLQFATALAEAAFQVDSGVPETARGILEFAATALDAPIYRSVILIQLARVALRTGKEQEAETLLLKAIALIGHARDADVVLLAQAKYNKAWIAYTRGNFNLEAIREARKALEIAAPDDQHHGNVATLHGLFLIKEIERNHPHLSSSALTAKCNEAVAYLSHAVYLLVRAEDFWGAQETCWNLAYGLFLIGNFDVRVTSPTGAIGRNTLEIKRFIDLSEAIMKGHGTDGFSVRNRVLMASVHMIRDRNLDEADKEFAEAEYQVTKAGHQISPRELGRLYERRVHYFLERCAEVNGSKSNLQKHACDAFEKAKRYWSSPGLESLLEHELLTRYERRGNTVRRL